MLKAFDDARENFRETGFRLLIAHPFDSKKYPKNHKRINELLALATDIEQISIMLRDLYSTGVIAVSSCMDSENVAYNEYMQQYITANPGAVFDAKFFANAPKRKDESEALSISKNFGVMLKSFLFFIRAYQDSLYRLGLLVTENNAGNYSSMQKAVADAIGTLKDRDPVGKLFLTGCPEYGTWFAQMRNLRNKIKEGLGVSYSTGKNFLTNEVTFAVQIRRPDTDDWPTVSIGDATAALLASDKSTRIIVEAGVKSGMLL